MKTVVGVLALQGAYQKHVDILQSPGVSTVLVRQPHQLEQCSALIIPGGESTTISLLIQKNGLYQPIKSFAEKHPVMGVCAGMILMATEVDDERVIPLGLIPFRAKRNFYGRQVHSFQTEIKLDFDKATDAPPYPAIFIRAPGVDNISPSVTVLASKEDEAIMLKKGQHMALSFHPELTADARIHEYWLKNSTTMD
jgi:5'-phosphate synthase pdxT subunit